MTTDTLPKITQSTSLLYWRKGINAVMLVMTGILTVVAIIPLIWIVAYVIGKGISAISIAFFTQLPTPAGIPGGGLLNALVGSFITVGIGIIIAAPVGVLAAFYVVKNPDKPIGLAIRFATDVISGVPSIVMGIFAYTIIVLPQRHFSALSGCIVLSFIMLPIILRTTEEMLRLVPSSLREGSLALGASEWRTALSVTLPAASSGILTGLMLAISRGAGEAAPMLFTAFGNPFLSTNLNQPVATLPQTIYVYAISPYADWKAKAWGTALVLIMVVLMFNITARLIVWWRSRRLGMR
jgi:phosphate transport system permease protein